MKQGKTLVKSKRTVNDVSVGNIKVSTAIERQQMH